MEENALDFSFRQLSSSLSATPSITLLPGPGRAASSHHQPEPAAALEEDGSEDFSAGDADSVEPQGVLPVDEGAYGSSYDRSA